MEGHSSDNPWWKTRSAAVALGFLAVISFFLAVEHRAHLLGILPLLFLLACPLMHFFHHGRHGQHGGHGRRADTDENVNP